MTVKMEEYRKGWPVLLSCILGCSVGVHVLLQYSLGPLIAPLTKEFGWTSAQITGAMFFKSVGVLIMAVAVGALSDRHGARQIALLSLCLLACACFGMTLIPGNIWFFYAGYVVIVVAGAGTLPMIWTRVLVGWFSAGRGLAIGISLMGNGLVGAMLPSYVTWLADHWGWRGAFIGLGILPLVVGLPITLWAFREPPRVEAPKLDETRTGDAAQSEAPPGFTFRAAIGTRVFWQMGAAFALGPLVLIGVLVNLVPLLTDRGMSRDVAAALTGLFGIAVVAGRLLTGWLLDNFNPERTVALLLLIPLAGCLGLFISGTNILACGLGVALLGIAAGMEADAAAYLAARYYGRAHYGAIYGLLYTIITLSGGVGPFIISTSFGRTGSYSPALIGGAGLFAISSLLVGLLRPRMSAKGGVAMLAVR
uniref:MFS transporter n=1 Tax=Sphingomonas bacterium TaxID=1895847 RepID=UPI0026392E95|nr:MFS transporter [Sphingomonas bacterium]